MKKTVSVVLATVTLSLGAAVDLGELFASKEAWSESAVDFTVDHARDGFEFASQKRDIVNCLTYGASGWRGIPAYESRIYYGAEGATRVEISLYNRGDDRSGGALDEAELKKLLAKVAALVEPNGKIGAPSKRKLKNGGFAYVRDWPKADPAVELAWGMTGERKGARTADYVRLTLTPKAESRTKGAAKTVSGSAAKAKVKANVTKNAEGDVFIKNVPMVDQGQKGYCAVATSERVLRYYGQTVDEHELAQMAGSTAEGGTNIREMRETVREVGSKCRLGYVEIVTFSSNLRDLEQEVADYNREAKTAKEPTLSIDDFTEGNLIHIGSIRAAMKPKVLKKMRMKDTRFKRFLAGVKTQVDQGIPVIWGVTLGIFPEPGLPQSSGGHLRLIIGYNAKTKEILYSDSWGAGHELKRMPEDWAFAITHDAFYLKPL